MIKFLCKDTLQRADCIRQRYGEPLPEGLHLKSISSEKIKSHSVTPWKPKILSLDIDSFASNTTTSLLHLSDGLNQQEEPMTGVMCHVTSIIVRHAPQSWH